MIPLMALAAYVVVFAVERTTDVRPDARDPDVLARAAYTGPCRENRQGGTGGALYA
jgi:hypothetical protein